MGKKIGKLDETDGKTSKVMTLNKELHHGSDVYRL